MEFPDALIKQVLSLKEQGFIMDSAANFADD
jgi:hypothetical protein